MSSSAAFGGTRFELVRLLPLDTAGSIRSLSATAAFSPTNKQEQAAAAVATPPSSTESASTARPTSGANTDDLHDKNEKMDGTDGSGRTHQILTGSDGKQYALIPAPSSRRGGGGSKRRKLKPSIIQKRVSRLRTYTGKEENIRHSPWRLNLICQFAAGLTVPEALVQLDYCQKSRAPLVQKVIKRTSNLADIRHGLQPSQLEVAECFATQGVHLKRIQFMARGRSGKKLRRHSHMRVVLREIDFPLKIELAKSVNQKKKWIMREQAAKRDYEKARLEREELEVLQRKSAAAAAEKEEEEKE